MYCWLAFRLFMTIAAVCNVATCIMLYNTFIEGITLLTYALISGHPRGLTPGNPRVFASRHLQIPPTQSQYSSTKSYQCPSLGEHNLKRLPNCNIISCTNFNKSLTIIYTVSKNSQSTCFLHTARFSYIPCKS